jgi:TPR repeat protein
MLLRRDDPDIHQGVIVSRRQAKRRGRYFLLSIISGASALSFLPLVFASSNHSSSDANPDGLAVVDCLLPAEIRRLGGQMTYLGPRQPVRATADECSIRGGEYVAYDRANFSTAFQVWLPKAQDGDPLAQTYVGEIYEKGMGQPPDLRKAAEWYQKAADKGYAHAQSNLAYFYEKGLGVPQDPVKALNLYRRAAGITDDQLTFASEVTAVRTQMQGQLDALTAQLEQQTQQAESLQQQLDQSRQQISDRRAALESAHREMGALRKQLADAKAAGPSDAAALAKAQQLEGELKSREAVIAQQQSEIGDLEKSAAQREAELQSQIAAANSQGSKLRSELGERSTDSASTRVQLAAAEERLKATDQQVAELKRQLEEQRAAVAQQTDRLKNDLAGANADRRNRQSETEQTRQAIAQREVALKQQAATISGLESKEAEYQQQIASLRKAQSDEDQRVKQQSSEIQNVRAELALTQQKYVQTQQQLADANAAVQSERTRVAAEQADLQKRLAASSAEQLKEIKDLNQELSNREGELVEQRTRVAQLEAQKGEYSERIAQLVKVRSDTPPPTVPVPARAAIAIPKELSIGNYYALIIGNNSYQFMPNLDTAVNDARAVDRTLRERYGFKTKLLENATRGQMLSAINDLRNSLKESDNLLIYYAGHGELDEKNLRGYWLPINARRDDATEWVSDQQITDQIALMAARHVLVVADSCYSGAMTRSAGVRLITTSGTDDAEVKRLTTLYKLPSRTVLTSGGKTPVLDGGGGSNSIFARALVDILNRNDRILEGSALWNQIFDPVKRAAAQFKVDESPRYSGLPDAGHMNGEFLFIPRAS